MAGLMDRLSAVKAKQQEIAEQKAAAEKAKVEKEARRGELSVERERVAAEVSLTESAAGEAESALQEVSAMEAQGDLDEDMKAELATIKAEAQATKDAFSKLKNRLAEIDTEIAALENGEVAAVGEASVESLPVASAESSTPEVPQPAEVTTEKVVTEIAPADSKKEGTQGESAVSEKFSKFLQQDVQEWVDYYLSVEGEDKALERIYRALKDLDGPKKYPVDPWFPKLKLPETERRSVTAAQRAGYRQQLKDFLSENKLKFESRRKKFEDSKKILFDKKWESSLLSNSEPPTHEEAVRLFHAYQEIIDQGKGSRIWQDRYGIVAMMRDERVRQDALIMYTEKGVPTYEDAKKKFLSQRAYEPSGYDKWTHEAAIMGAARQIYDASFSGLAEGARNAIKANFMAAHEEEFRAGRGDVRQKLLKESASLAAKEIKPIYEKAVAQFTAVIKDIPPDSAHLLDFSNRYRDTNLATYCEMVAQHAKEIGVDTTGLFEAARNILKNSRNPDQLRMLEELASS